MFHQKAWVDRNNILWIYIVILMFGGTIANAQGIVEIPPIDFGGGLNLRSSPNLIADNESPDMLNMINTLDGASIKRNGSKRYISQAVSSFPVTSLFRAYGSTGTDVRKALIMTSADSIYFSSKDISPQFIKISSGSQRNQTYSYAQMGNRIILTGNGLTDPIRQFDVVTASMTDLLVKTDGSSNTIIIRAKYLFNTRDRLIAANVAEVSSAAALVQSTTYYPSRFYYSLLNQASSMTVSRLIDITPGDGAEINGVGELNRFVHIFKESSIAEMEFTILNLLALGGDQVVRTIVNGFGLYAPRTLANTGDFYILGTKDGLRLWDGGRKTRLNLEQESRILTLKIQPIIDKIIRAGTYKNSVGKYYPKKQWYLFAYEDPDIFPRGANNSILVYDFITNNWYKFKNWNVASFATMDGIGDNGDLVYGDSMDGYVYLADIDTSLNDARKEIVLDTMDSTTSWTGSNTDYTNVREGTGSIRIINTGAQVSSATIVKVFSVGEWYDKSIITKRDKLSFKVFVTTLANLTNIRVDLEVNDVQNNFDTNFTSITISSATLIRSNTAFTTIELALSSFPIRQDWVSIDSETVPFANTLTFFGIRFVVTSATNTEVSIDDLRIVQDNENPISTYRVTKQFSFNTLTDKRFRELILDRELSSNSNITIDIFNNFGQVTKRITAQAKYPQEIFVGGFDNSNNITALDSNDFRILRQTSTLSESHFEIRHLAVDELNIYAADRQNDRLLKMSRSSMTVFSSTFGAFGTGTTNFDTIHQIALDDDSVYLVDNRNNRIKVHKKRDLSFQRTYGQLGLGETNFHNPTGIAVDDTYMYVGDEGNYAIKKLTKSTGGIVATEQLNMNTIGEMTLAVDERFLYCAYHVIAENDILLTDIALEKRNKESLELVSKVLARPQNVIISSTYTVVGDIGITDDFLYITFSDDIIQSPSWYIQKRLKSDFSIVSEFKTNEGHFSIAGNAISYKPKRANQIEILGVEGSFLQLRYSTLGLDTNMKLFSQSLLLVNEPVKEHK